MADRGKWLIYGAGVGLLAAMIFLIQACLPAGVGKTLDGGGLGPMAFLFMVPVVLSIPAAYFGLKRWSAVFYAVYLIGVIIFASILRSAAGAKNLGGAIIMPVLGFLALGYAIAIGIVAGLAVEAAYWVYKKVKGAPHSAAASIGKPGRGRQGRH